MRKADSSTGKKEKSKRILNAAALAHLYTGCSADIRNGSKTKEAEEGLYTGMGKHSHAEYRIRIRKKAGNTGKVPGNVDVYNEAGVVF